MSTAVMTLGSLQQQLQPPKKMVMMLSPPTDLQSQIVQPSNGACVIVSANTYPATSPQHFTNLDAPTATTTTNNNNIKAKNNNNLNKVNRVGGGAVQKASARTSVVVTAASSAAADALRCKRRIQFSQGERVTFSGHQTASVARRNARERNRVKQVNNGFATLRSHIPPAIAAALQEASPAPCERSGSSSSSSSGRSSAKDKEAAKKLSKVETLRMAVEYIRRLQDLLHQTNNENALPGNPVNVKTESVVLPDSPSNGFDADYEAALALSHYSMAAESTTAHGVVTSTTAFHPHFVSMSPPCSDAGSAGSPTPSYVSDGSVGASSTGYAPPTFLPTTTTTTTGLPTHHTGLCRPTHLGHPPATPPDSNLYEPMSPEDEELLDVISWWQQSN